MRPSPERKPSGSEPKMSRAAAQGAPIRSECKKAHMRAGKGRGGPAQLKAPAVNGGDVTGRASHGVGPTTRAS